MKLEQLFVSKNFFFRTLLLFLIVATSIRVVSANSPPVLSNATEAGILVVEVNEGVLEVLTLVASDDDRDVVTFSLFPDENETKDPEFFDLDASSGVLSFVEAPNYDVPDDFDGNNVYAFTILYTDGNTSPIPVEVHVSVSPSNTTYSLLTTAQEGGEVSDGGEHRAGSQIILTATPQDGYAFSGWEGDVFVNANETSITLTMDRNKSVTGTFTRQNTPPSFTNDPSVEFNENETTAFSLTAIDADEDTMTFSISGTDGVFFSLNADTGLLEFVSQPDFENPLDYNSDNTYELQATVTDDQLNSASSDIRIIILDDTTEPPTHFNLTVVVEGEGDVVVSGQNLASANETFSYAVGSSLTLTATASSADYGFTKWTGDLNGSGTMKELTMESDKNVTAVFTKVNFAPSLTSPQYSINVTYHYENNASVFQFLAEDLDGDGITFHLAESGDYLLFDLNASTGILTFKSAPDYENPSDIGSDNIYDLNVSVSDGQASSPFSPVQFTILDLPDDGFTKWTGDLNGSDTMKELPMESDKNVTAVFTIVNSAPSLTSPQSSINVAYHYENNAFVVQFLAEDPDGDGITFHLAESGDYLLFDLNASTGILTFKSAPDYENPSDIGSDNIYDLNVSVSDGQASSPFSPVQFTILDLLNDEWSLAEDKGVGWRYFSWFGNYYEANADWIYHEEHGWLYRSGETTASTWFYDSQLGWLWTSESAYPSFHHEDMGWLYYKAGEGNARKFYDYFNESWLEVMEE